MYILMVRIKVKEDKIQEFIESSIGDAEGSVMNEPGCRRFDIIQDNSVFMHSVLLRNEDFVLQLSLRRYTY